MLVNGQQRSFIRKMALEGDPFIPNTYLRVIWDALLGPRLIAVTYQEAEPGEEMFLQRSRFPHIGSPQAPVVYKCSLGPPEELADFVGMPVVIWNQVLSGARTVTSMPEVFIVLVEGEE